ncbi:hypothetical protein GCM10007853_07920 [Algimonas ampicilliniresistens]|uniref:Uncharacterized protein n=1 Tax=Algimonas ampicilliniresistens TaxID=1298735 RepID=A0ABQ5V616_9PROT|nr:hypothetical protein [Algimonas ampicilliniresistens]GLQ22918.1 hypothetical protein GCM10007853_07920 [Algimonas ampicilliniresistens]
MTYKSTLQLSDLNSGERLELTCNSCGFARFVRYPHELKHPASGKDISHLYLDEFESKARCAKSRTRALAGRKCGGTVRLLVIDPADKPEPFSAGMASETFDRKEVWRRERIRRAKR